MAMKMLCFSRLLLLTIVAGLLAGIPNAPAGARNSGSPSSVSQIARSVGAAVVNIRAEKHVVTGEGAPMEEDGPLEPFERYFGMNSFGEFTRESLGSGVVIDEKGVIVTNHHVIEGADDIQIHLKDGKIYDAEIFGWDPHTDLALLRISTPVSLPAVRLGDSDRLSVGQWVVAIGNPFGLGHTVTAGIVSAKGRVIGSGPYDDFIQTDASINPGNSGGPLIDLSGNVVGINTAVMSSGNGIGFAVPINLARGVIEQLQETGEVIRGWLGVATQEITPEMAEYCSVSDRGGLFVTEVFDGGPAAAAGIRPRDVIISVDGAAVASPRELTRIVAGIPVGSTARIDTVRGHEKHVFDVTIARRDDAALAVRVGGWREKADALGIQIAELTEDVAQQLNIPLENGVIVTSVAKGSSAAAAGVQAGDVVREIDHEVITSAADYHRRIADSSNGEALHFFIRRAGQGFIVIKVAREK